MIVKLKRLICQNILFLQMVLMMCFFLSIWNSFTLDLGLDHGNNGQHVKEDAVRVSPKIISAYTRRPTDVMTQATNSEKIIFQPALTQAKASTSRASVPVVQDSSERRSDEMSYTDKMVTQSSISESDILLAGKIRQNRSYLVIGIPTARREKANYILGTLHGIIRELSEEEKDEVVIIVFSSDFDLAANKKVAELVRQNFALELERGLILVIRAPRNSYSTLEKLQPLWGDKPDRVKWRSKQCLDYAFLFNYGRKLGMYYLQIEDDVNTERNFYKQIKGFVIQNKDEKWSVLDFGARGFIGVLYRSEDLERLALFVKMYYWIWPVDILFRHFNDFNLYGNDQKFVHKPLLFKHIGQFSTLHGQVRKVEGTDLASRVGFKIHKTSDNPPAIITTSILEHTGGHGVDGPYSKDKVEMFWAKNIKIGDNITIMFIDPIKLAKFILETASTSAVDDFPGGIILNAAPARDGSQPTKAAGCGKFSLELQRYQDEAHIEYTNKNLSNLKIKCLQIVITGLRKDPVGRVRWLLIREFAVWVM